MSVSREKIERTLKLGIHYRTLLHRSDTHRGDSHTESGHKERLISMVKRGHLTREPSYTKTRTEELTKSGKSGKSIGKIQNVVSMDFLARPLLAFMYASCQNQANNLSFPAGLTCDHHQV